MGNLLKHHGHEAEPTALDYIQQLYAGLSTEYAAAVAQDPTTYAGALVTRGQLAAEEAADTVRDFLQTWLNERHTATTEIGGVHPNG